MSGEQNTTLRQLQKIQSTIAHLTALLRQSEAARDALIQRLADSDGAHDRRPVGCR